MEGQLFHICQDASMLCEQLHFFYHVSIFFLHKYLNGISTLISQNEILRQLSLLGIQIVISHFDRIIFDGIQVFSVVCAFL